MFEIRLLMMEVMGSITCGQGNLFCEKQEERVKMNPSRGPRREEEEESTNGKEMEGNLGGGGNFFLVDENLRVVTSSIGPEELVKRNADVRGKSPF